MFWFGLVWFVLVWFGFKLGWRGVVWWVCVRMYTSCPCPSLRRKHRPQSYPPSLFPPIKTKIKPPATQLTTHLAHNTDTCIYTHTFTICSNECTYAPRSPLGSRPGLCRRRPPRGGRCGTASRWCPPVFRGRLIWVKVVPTCFFLGGGMSWAFDMVWSVAGGA